MGRLKDAFTALPGRPPSGYRLLLEDPNFARSLQAIESNLQPDEEVVCVAIALTGYAKNFIIIATPSRLCLARYSLGGRLKDKRWIAYLWPGGQRMTSSSKRSLGIGQTLTIIEPSRVKWQFKNVYPEANASVISSVIQGTYTDISSEVSGLAAPERGSTSLRWYQSNAMLVAGRLPRTVFDSESIVQPVRTNIDQLIVELDESHIVVVLPLRSGGVDLVRVAPDDVIIEGSDRPLMRFDDAVISLESADTAERIRSLQTKPSENQQSGTHDPALLERSLRALTQLHNDGIISESEFDERKAEILRRF